jgi:putative hydrolase of HD superfamily
MCLFHDLAEARTGDANSINKHYLDLHEERAVADQMEGLPIAEEIINNFQEYEARQSREAAIAKDADVLDQMILQQEYFYKDAVNGKIWQTASEQRLNTDSAKAIAKKIRVANPFEWLYSTLEKKRNKKIDK